MLSPIKTYVSEKLKDKSYRKKFFRGQAQYEIAFQLRSARKSRGLTQPELEKQSGMKQSAISRLEQASYSRWNFQSILCLADALDLRVRVIFDYAENVISEYERLEEEERDAEEMANRISGNPAIYDQIQGVAFIEQKTSRNVPGENNEQKGEGYSTIKRRGDAEAHQVHP